MKQTFDYLENVPNIAATVCDKERIVLYQNKRAIDRDGDVVGKHKLLHQTPWYDEEGNVAGLIELAIDLPDEMPVFDRG